MPPDRIRAPFRIRPDLAGYLGAVASGAVAIILRTLLDPYLGDGYPFVFSFAAVAVAAAFGGWKLGALATLFNFLAADWFFIPPRHTFGFSPTAGGLWAVGSFVVTCGVITSLAHVMRKAERVARSAVVLRDNDRERLCVTLHSIGDAVIATDPDGTVTYLNPVAERLTGWREVEAIGRPLREVFNIINGITRAPDRSPVDRVISDNQVIDLGNHTVLIAKDGSERSIADSAAPIRAGDGGIIGVVLVFRDVTVQRAAELRKARKAQEQRVLTGALERLLASRDAEALVSDLCREVMSHVRADVFVHFRVNDSGDSLILQGSEGIPQDALKEVEALDVGGGVCGAVADPREPLTFSDIQASPGDQTPFLRQVGLKACVRLPLIASDHLLGTLSFGSRSRTAFDEDELHFVRSISQHVALALDRLNHEKQLQSRERQLAEQARLLNLSNDGIIVCDWDDRILYWNRGAEDIYGYSAAESVGRIKHELLHTQSALPRAEIMAQLERDNRWQGELTHTCKDGRRIVVITRWALDRDSDGKPASILKSDNDITARKEAEEKLRNSQQQLRMVADHIPALVGYIDRQLVYRYLNAAYSEWFGRDPSELLGKPVSEVIDPVTYAHRLPYIQAALRGEEVRFDGPANHCLRGPRHTEVVYIPERSHGEVQGFYVFVQDVSDRVRAQQVLEEQARELREAGRRKDEFLAMLAHELRNPLASASSATALLKASAEPESRGWAVEVIDRQISHLARLIDDLLDVSRITSGKIRLQKEIVDTGAILRRATDAAMPLIREKGHTFVPEYPQDSWALPIEADPTRLEQIVSNLLTNAAKYTEPGGTIWLRARKDVSSAGEVFLVIAVRDSGIGIPPERIDSMFELFVQGERSIARSEGGLGIGLTLVKKLTEMHGGTVQAHSGGLGQGSEFVIRIPAGAVGRIPGQTAPGGIPEAAVSRNGGERVLVVDDNRDTAIGMERLLKLWGYEVVAAYSGEAAIAEARRFAPRVVLLDIGLPGLDGYEVCRQLRNASGCKDALIIAISGYGQDEDRRRSKEAGFDHHLIKPVDFGELRALLASRSTNAGIPSSAN